MLRKSLFLKLFDAAFMQRWNDKVRPMELTELDKQAHKMVIAYMIGKHEEHTPGFDWLAVIEGGLFELLQRLVLTDLKPPIFHKIRADAEKYRQLNAWVYDELKPFINTLGEPFCCRFRNHFEPAVEDINRRVLSAAHFYATNWEFDIIRKANPTSYDIDAIEADIQAKREKYRDLAGIRALKAEKDLPERDKKLTRFLNLCGELRFQARWSNLHRIPRTSVMGHMLFVAILSYLFSLEIGACPRRSFNNYFTGLFHDLPEVLTRDIISPVKKSVAGLSDLIKDYEKELLAREVYELIPPGWHAEIRMFVENEFSTLVDVDGRTHVLDPPAGASENVKPDPSDRINTDFNQDRFNPRDGKLVRAADHLAAFIEAYVGIRNGSASQELWRARVKLEDEYQNHIQDIGGINFGEIYSDFD